MALPDFALSVGINFYPGLTSLSGAEADARSFHDWATSEGGVPPPNASLILSSRFPLSPQTSRAQPSSQEIWNFFEVLRAAAMANNANNLGAAAGRRLYLFFSGHGFSPSLDLSGVLMANAERDTPHNLSPKAWADRFYENGLFEEVLLFQDACREPVNDVDLTPPYLKRSVMGGIVCRKRFYAFAAKSPLLALEKPIGGVVRGVFSATLMAGLEGGARDPGTGAITTDSLRTYLRDNMAKRLEAADLANEDISRKPEMYAEDSFEIVPAAAHETVAAAPPTRFPVQVTMLLPVTSATILDTDRQVVVNRGPGLPVWNTELPRGLFELVISGQPNRVFKVTGALGPTGQPEIVHVSRT